MQHTVNINDVKYYMLLFSWCIYYLLFLRDVLKSYSKLLKHLDGIESNQQSGIIINFITWLIISLYFSILHAFLPYFGFICWYICKGVYYCLFICLLIVYTRQHHTGNFTSVSERIIVITGYEYILLYYPSITLCRTVALGKGVAPRETFSTLIVVVISLGVVLPGAMFLIGCVVLAARRWRRHRLSDSLLITAQ